MFCWQDPEWFFILYGEKNCQGMYIRHINKGYNGRHGFSKEQLRICLSILNYDFTEKKEKTQFMEKFIKILISCIPVWVGISLKLN